MDRVYIVFGIELNGHCQRHHQILGVFTSSQGAHTNKRLREEATAEGVPTIYSSYYVESRIVYDTD